MCCASTQFMECASTQFTECAPAPFSPWNALTVKRAAVVGEAQAGVPQEEPLPRAQGRHQGAGPNAINARNQRLLGCENECASSAKSDATDSGIESKRAQPPYCPWCQKCLRVLDFASARCPALTSAGIALQDARYSFALQHGTDSDGTRSTDVAYVWCCRSLAGCTPT